MKNLLTALFMALMLVSYVAIRTANGRDGGQETATVVQPRPDPTPAGLKGRPLIQLALLLDTSNSMDGLIDQARTQLWDLVNEFATARRGGKAPNLQVALYEYGNLNLSAESGYIRRVLPLTDDLDRVSEALFALQTRGGDEYCGQVIGVATKELDWSPASATLKAIYIAGNEPFTQGSVDFRRTCREAAAAGINVNTIFCGPYQEGVSGSWREGAVAARGAYANIDQNRVAAAIETPYDRHISALNSRLNSTYVPYGAGGAVAATRQMAQDQNAASRGLSSLSARVTAKSTAQYRNTSWDLVDAVKAGEANVAAMPAAALPAPMQQMDAGQRARYVENQSKEREQIQVRIRKLGEERRRYLARNEKGKSDTLGGALSQSLRTQAGAKGFTFK